MRNARGRAREAIVIGIEEGRVVKEGKRRRRWGEKKEEEEEDGGIWAGFKKKLGQARPSTVAPQAGVIVM